MAERPDVTAGVIGSPEGPGGGVPVRPPAMAPAPSLPTVEAPSLGSVSGYAPNYAAQAQSLVSQLGMGGTQPSGLPGGTPNVAETTMFNVPGFGNTNIATILNEPYSRKPVQIIQLQKNLVAAGYLNPKSVDIPGWYDAATFRAYAALTEESVNSGQLMATVLRGRALLKAGKTEAAAKILGGGKDESPEDAAGTHLANLQQAYEQVWGQAPPPNYLDQFQGLNPEELVFNERAKPAWEQSSVAQKEHEDLANFLSSFLANGKVGG